MRSYEAVATWTDMHSKFLTKVHALIEDWWPYRGGAIEQIDVCTGESIPIYIYASEYREETLECRKRSSTVMNGSTSLINELGPGRPVYHFAPRWCPELINSLTE